MKGLKIKLPMGNESEISLTSKLLGKRKKRNMHTNNSVIFLGERAVSPRGPNAVTLKQGNVSFFYLSLSLSLSLSLWECFIAQVKHELSLIFYLNHFLMQCP